MIRCTGLRQGLLLKKFKGADYRKDWCLKDSVMEHIKWKPSKELKKKLEEKNDCYFDSDTVAFHKGLVGKTSMTVLSSAKPVNMISDYKKYAYPLISNSVYMVKDEKKNRKHGVKSIYLQPGSLTKGSGNLLIKNRVKKQTTPQQFNDQMKKFKTLGHRKFNQFVRFMRAYPELCGKVAFIGDDGQGDYDGMVKMLNYKNEDNKKCLLFGALKLSVYFTDANKRGWTHNGGFAQNIQGHLNQNTVNQLHKRHKNKGQGKRFFTFQHYSELYIQLKKVFKNKINVIRRSSKLTKGKGANVNTFQPKTKNDFPDRKSVV